MAADYGSYGSLAPRSEAGTWDGGFQDGRWSDPSATRWSSKREGEELPATGTKFARVEEEEEPGEIKIPQQFVGWLKGKGGGQIREIENKSGAQVSIDQSTKELGYSRVLLAGSANAVQVASDIINNELRRVMERDGLSQAAAPPPSFGEEMQETQIPQKYVGWLKGSGGSQINDMEMKSGAHVRIDQSTREMGYSVAQITGSPDAVRLCKELIEAEVLRVQERDRVVTEHTQRPGFQHSPFNEIQIPQQYVGWIKGSGGSQIKAIETRTGAHVTIDQSTQDLGYSRAMVYGSDAAVLAAKQFIQSELARVMDRDSGSTGEPGGAPAPATNPDAADVLSSLVTTLLTAAGSPPDQIGPIASAISAAAGGSGSSGVPRAAEKATRPVDPGDTGEWDQVRIPNTCVGWLKGRQGAMIREIESKSGAQVDINQTTKEMGYSTAQMRGSLQQKKVAHGLVIAEVTKVMDQSGEPLDGSFPGVKADFRIDAQYVGWVKGPRGKVVQDIQVKSGTRIDVDQSTPDLGYATVKVFGTLAGTQQARALIAAELSKISPEAAAQIVSDLPGGLETAQQVARHAAQSFVPPMQPMFSPPAAGHQAGHMALPAPAHDPAAANPLAFAASSPQPNLGNLRDALAAVCGGAAGDIFGQLQGQQPQQQQQQFHTQQFAFQASQPQAPSACGQFGDPAAAFASQAYPPPPDLGGFLPRQQPTPEMQDLAQQFQHLIPGQPQQFAAHHTPQPDLSAQLMQPAAHLRQPTYDKDPYPTQAAHAATDWSGQPTQPVMFQEQSLYEQQASPPQLQPPPGPPGGGFPGLAGLVGQQQQPDSGQSAAAALQLLASLQQLATAVNQVTQVQTHG